jgi:hypothetical protein
METFSKSFCATTSGFVPPRFMVPPTQSLSIPPMLDTAGTRRDSFRDFLPPQGPGSGLPAANMPQVPCNLMFKGKDQGPDDMKFVDFPSAFHLIYRTGSEIGPSTACDKGYQMDISSNSEGSYMSSQENATELEIRTIASMFCNDLIR